MWDCPAGRKVSLPALHGEFLRRRVGRAMGVVVRMVHAENLPPSPESDKEKPRRQDADLVKHLENLVVKRFKGPVLPLLSAGNWVKNSGTV